MNSLTIIIIILSVINIYFGLKKGFVAMMLPVLTNIVTLVLLSCTRSLWSEVVMKWVLRDVSLIMARVVVLILLYIILIAIIKFVIASLHILTSLPLIRTVNKLLGVIAAIMAVMLEVWAFFALVYVLREGALGNWALPQIMQNEQLVFLYDHNLVTYIISDFF